MKTVFSMRPSWMFPCEDYNSLTPIETIFRRDESPLYRWESPAGMIRAGWGTHVSPRRRMSCRILKLNYIEAYIILRTRRFREASPNSLSIYLRKGLFLKWILIQWTIRVVGIPQAIRILWIVYIPGAVGVIWVKGALRVETIQWVDVFQITWRRYLRREGNFVF